MKQAQVLTEWTMGIDNVYRPRLVQDYELLSCTDVTGQPASNILPNPNALIVEIITNDDIMDTIVSSEIVLWIADYEA